MNSLNLQQVDGGSQIKQGDYGSRLAFELLDENFDTIKELNGNIAQIKLLSGTVVKWQSTAVVSDNVVGFNLDKILSVGTYRIEIVVDDYVFPSDRQTRLVVIKSATDYVPDNLVEAPDLTNIGSRISGLEERFATLAKSQEVYEQTEPSSTWTIIHSLNKYPSVTVVDSGYNTVFGDVEYISPQKIIIRFSALFAGKAILN